MLPGGWFPDCWVNHASIQQHVYVFQRSVDRIASIWEYRSQGVPPMKELASQFLKLRRTFQEFWLLTSFGGVPLESYTLILYTTTEATPIDFSLTPVTVYVVPATKEAATKHCSLIPLPVYIAPATTEAAPNHSSLRFTPRSSIPLTVYIVPLQKVLQTTPHSPLSLYKKGASNYRSFFPEPFLTQPSHYGKSSL